MSMSEIKTKLELAGDHKLMQLSADHVLAVQAVERKLSDIKRLESDLTRANAEFEKLQATAVVTLQALKDYFEGK